MTDTAIAKATENARRWIEQWFEATSPQPPLSFIYAGKASDELFNTWELQRDEKKLDEQRTQHMLRYKDRSIGLEVK